MEILPDDWRAVTPATPGIPRYSVFTKPIKKARQDEREYRIIKLDNGLKATLVHDETTDKGAASLDVAVGSFFDPEDMPGLAHFCEHLLFMGTENFPREDEYQEYISKNNGYSNAYTRETNTNYRFEVTSSALRGALERFSAFFHSPLFSPSCTSRELNNVDSEYNDNHQEDTWRISQVKKHLSKPDHVWSRFDIGNRKSLSKTAELKMKGKLQGVSPSDDAAADGGAVGREIRRRLEKWWREEYYASRMSLCIIGNESLDELSNMASELFSRIPNRNKDLPLFDEHPLGPAQKKMLVAVQTVEDLHRLEISFPLEYQPPLWRYKPADFLAHLIGHEGLGSLHSHLKGNGWITSLNAGTRTLARSLATFEITVDLTEEGFSNYRLVIEAVFSYLSLLRTAELEDYHQKEIARLSSVKFQFQAKQWSSDYAMGISEHMHWPLPAEELISGPVEVQEWGSNREGGTGVDIIDRYLNSFRLAEGRVFLMAKGENLEKIMPKIQWAEEPWYGTRYYAESIDQNLLDKTGAPTSIRELALPKPNIFIPKNLDVDKGQLSEPLKRPFLIRETSLTILWHKKDDQFLLPKAIVVVDIRIPESHANAKAAVLTRLYVDLVNDALTETVYDARLAGLEYQLSDISTGLHLRTEGYNDKLSTLLEIVLRKASDFTVSPDRLRVVKEQVAREWRNFHLGHPWSLSEYYLRYILSHKEWTIEERLKELESITHDELAAYSRELSKAQLQMLITGNISRDEALRIADKVEQHFQEGGRCKSDLSERTLIPCPKSNHIWSVPLTNANEENSALAYYLHYGSIVDPRLRVTAALLTQILTQPADDVLRTKERLGYIVDTQDVILPGFTEGGLCIVIQSVKPPGYLEQRVEDFLQIMMSEIQDMSSEEFEEHKNTVRNRWLEVDKNLEEETSYFKNHIASGLWDFLRRYEDAELVLNIQKNEVLDLYHARVNPSSPTRAKLSVHMVPSQAEAEHPIDGEHMDSPAPEKYIKDIKQFRDTLKISGHPDPLVHWHDLTTAKP